MNEPHEMDHVDGGTVVVMTRARLIPHAILHAMIGVGFVAVLYFVVPKYTKVFEDFGVELPMITQFVVSLSWSVVGLGILLPVVMVFAMAADVAVLYVIFPRQWIWSWMIVLAALLIAALIGLAIALPMAKLTTDLA